VDADAKDASGTTPRQGLGWCVRTSARYTVNICRLRSTPSSHIPEAEGIAEQGRMTTCPHLFLEEGRRDGRRCRSKRRDDAKMRGDARMPPGRDPRGLDRFSIPSSPVPDLMGGWLTRNRHTISQTAPIFATWLPSVQSKPPFNSPLPGQVSLDACRQLLYRGPRGRITHHYCSIPPPMSPPTGVSNLLGVSARCNIDSTWFLAPRAGKQIFLPLCAP